MRKTSMRLAISGLIGLIFAVAAQAAVALKFQRASQLGAALEHLNEIASLLVDPIERIEYVGNEVHFVAGKCYVPVIIGMKPLTPKELQIAAPVEYTAQVGPAQCTP